MKKKAQQTDLKNIILVLIVGAILLGFAAGTFIPWTKIFGEENACKLSILAAAKTKAKMAGTETNPMFNIDCAEQSKLIKYQDFKKNDGSIDSNKVKLALATEMYKCWEKTGQGQLDPFADWNGNPTYCLLCSSVQFDKEFKTRAGDDPNAEGAPLKGFSEYLTKTYVPGKNLTFYQSFFGRSPQQETTPEIQSQILQLDFVDYTKPQTVLWRVEVDGHSILPMGLASGGAGAAAAMLFLIPGLNVALGVGAIGLAVIGGYSAYVAADGKTLSMQTMMIPTEIIDSKFQGESNKDERFCQILVN